jgi:hypothetical protein
MLIDFCKMHGDPDNDFMVVDDLCCGLNSAGKKDVN